MLKMSDLKPLYMLAKLNVPLVSNAVDETKHS